MAALVKPAALQNVLRCYREQMLRQQHAETPMSGKSASFQFVRLAANGGAGASPENILGKMKGRMKHGMVLLNEKTGFENV